MNRLRGLTDRGQAIWLDYIRRDILESGELERLVREDGVTGVTSNPAIFEQAIGRSDLYDQEIGRALMENPQISVEALYEQLAFQDIRLAADTLRPVYEEKAGADGFVSLEVSPHLARDTERTIAEARRFWKLVDRPNLMIKVPATREGVPAVERLLATGINVNITLMFSLAHYEAVAQAYLRGVEQNPSPERVGSVASFFVSRVDSLIDKKLEALGGPEALDLRGRIAVANSKLTYQRFLEIFEGEEFGALSARGARPQRVLWASTSTKNPAYSDVLYVEDLIGPATVNTLPPSTLEAFRDHGRSEETITAGLESARETLARLDEMEIDLDQAAEQLQQEGLEKFAEPFDRLLETLDRKKAALLGAAAAG
jgi:transaldolase